ncbi:hypothetical protein BKA69DRAFT_1129468 [Paraphysoderma sedebokerense]|nr:hypothetical protein BKA69DRAFT_1129468 [Paraphysoderma sedebokerense]
MSTFLTERHGNPFRYNPGFSPSGASTHRFGNAQNQRNTGLQSSEISHSFNQDTLGQNLRSMGNLAGSGSAEVYHNQRHHSGIGRIVGGNNGIQQSSSGSANLRTKQFSFKPIPQPNVQTYDNNHVRQQQQTNRSETPQQGLHGECQWGADVNDDDEFGFLHEDPIKNVQTPQLGPLQPMKSSTSSVHSQEKHHFKQPAPPRVPQSSQSRDHQYPNTPRSTPQTPTHSSSKFNHKPAQMRQLKLSPSLKLTTSIQSLPGYSPSRLLPGCTVSSLFNRLQRYGFQDGFKNIRLAELYGKIVWLGNSNRVEVDSNRTGMANCIKFLVLDIDEQENLGTVAIQCEFWEIDYPLSDVYQPPQTSSVPTEFMELLSKETYRFVGSVKLSTDLIKDGEEVQYILMNGTDVAVDLTVKFMVFGIRLARPYEAESRIRKARPVQ